MRRSLTLASITLALAASSFSGADPNAQSPTSPQVETKPAAPSRPLQEGDQMPDFVLSNDRGERLTNENFAGKTLVITFMFTRCPSPDQCPLVSRNFEQLAQKIDGDAALLARIRLLSVSFDFLHDNWERLTNYRAAFDAPREIWQIATGSPTQIQKLVEAFSLSVSEQNGTLTHELCTAVIDPSGRITKIFRGNSWKPEDILAAAH